MEVVVAAGAAVRSRSMWHARCLAIAPQADGKPVLLPVMLNCRSWRSRRSRRRWCVGIYPCMHVGLRHRRSTSCCSCMNV